jgi:hypothetical protein
MRTNVALLLSWIAVMALTLLLPNSSPEPYAFRYYCTQHLAENVKERFGTEIESLFWQLMQVPTISEQAYTVGKILEISAVAVLG